MARDKEFATSACADYEAVLEDYLNGELGAADAKRVADHRKQCAGCNEAIEHAAASVRLLRASGPLPQPSPAFARTVMARIRMAERQQMAERAGFWQPFVSLGWRFAATASLAVALLLTFAVRSGNRPQPNVASVRPIIVTHDLFAPDPSRAPANRDEALMMVAENDHGNK
jgi:anti-sigma-K factor RskA